MLTEMLGPKAPARLHRLAERCLAQEPDQRPSSIRKVAVVLVGAGLSWAYRMLDPKAGQAYRAERLASFETSVLFPAISPDGQRLA